MSNHKPFWKKLFKNKWNAYYFMNKYNEVGVKTDLLGRSLLTPYRGGQFQKNRPTINSRPPKIDKTDLDSFRVCFSRFSATVKNQQSQIETSSKRFNPKHSQDWLNKKIARTNKREKFFATEYKEPIESQEPMQFKEPSKSKDTWNQQDWERERERQWQRRKSSSGCWEGRNTVIIVKLRLKKKNSKSQRKTILGYFTIFHI